MGDFPHLVDTHDHPAPSSVRSLYREPVRRFGPTSTLVEWGDHIPSLETFVGEAARARAAEAKVLDARPEPA